jgi:hypothetical protein
MFKLLLKTALVYILLTSVCQGKYKPEYADLPESTKLWYKKLHAPSGQWCCDESDGHPYFGNYDPLPDGGVRLGDGTVVPPSNVVITANPTGHAVWFYNDIDGTRHTYCFVPGTLS